MNNIPLISIIVPVYNVENYVDKCIDSVLSQTYKDWELILVDDGSTDNRGKICDDYALKDSRIKVIHKENGGLPSARKAGLEIAKGDFIFHLDGDDFIPENTLEILINKQKECDADIVIGDFQVVRGEQYCEIFNDYKFSFLNNIEYTKQLLNVGAFFVWGKLIRANINKNIEIPLDIQYTEDAIAMIQIANNAKKIAKVDAITYYYLKRENAYTSSISKKNLIQWYKSSVFIENYIKSTNKELIDCEEFIKFKLSQIAIYLQHTHISGKYRKDIPKYLRKVISKKRISIFTGNEQLMLLISCISTSAAIIWYKLYRKLKHIA